MSIDLPCSPRDLVPGIGTHGYAPLHQCHSHCASGCYEAVSAGSQAMAAFIMQWLSHIVSFTTEVRAAACFDSSDEKEVFALAQALEKAGLKPGQRLLVQAASGGVGSWIVQLAKCRGLHVTGTCSTPNVSFVRQVQLGRASLTLCTCFVVALWESDPLNKTVMVWSSFGVTVIQICKVLVRNAGQTGNSLPLVLTCAAQN